MLLSFRQDIPEVPTFEARTLTLPAKCLTSIFSPEKLVRIKNAVLLEIEEQAYKIIHRDQTVLLQSRETTAVALKIEISYWSL